MMRFQIPKSQWNKIEDYLEQLPQEETPGVTAEFYLDLMEVVLAEYDLQNLKEPAEDLQSYSRIVSVLAVLLSKGRRPELQEPFQKMMTLACQALPQYEGQIGLDFSMKELTLAYRCMKEYDTNGDWLKMLQNIVPEQYGMPNGEAHNINLYNVAAEALRTREGLADSTEYCQNCLTKQVAKLDENGMYPDNAPRQYNPVLYDLAARAQMQWAEYLKVYEFGDVLRRGGIWSLMTQSPTGQIPYGGRSNQYGMNEAIFASVMEYEAAKQAEAGHLVLAGRMRRSARLAAESIREFVTQHSHRRNLFAEEQAGCEAYGYSYKYMISIAAFLIGGVLFAREEIPERPCPCEKGGYLLTSGANFHQIFAVCGGYGIQIDADGDPCYDATGWGRIHYRRAPAALGLSLPFAGEPAYRLAEGAAPCSAALGIGWDDGAGGVQYLSELTGLKHAVAIEEESPAKVKFTVTYTGKGLKNCGGVMESYQIDEGGVRYSAKLLEADAGTVYARVPLFLTDGMRESVIKQRAGQCSVRMKGWVFRVTSGASLEGREREVCNRNGRYRLVTFMRLEPKIRLNLSFCRENTGE